MTGWGTGITAAGFSLNARVIQFPPVILIIDGDPGNDPYPAGIMPDFANV
jgi:hypothetical protein